MTESNHGYIGYFVAVNAAFWQSLPDDLRAGLEATLAEVTEWGNARSEAINQEDRQRIVDSGRSRDHGADARAARGVAGGDAARLGRVPRRHRRRSRRRRARARRSSSKRGMASPRGSALLRGADRLEEAFMIVALAFMTLLTFVQVVLRYGFGTGLRLVARSDDLHVRVARADRHVVRRAHRSAHRRRPRDEPAVAAAARASSRPSRSCCGLAYCALMIYGSAQFVERSDDARQQRARHSAAALAAHGHHADRVRLLALRLVQAARPVLWPRASAGRGAMTAAFLVARAVRAAAPARADRDLARACRAS